MKIVFMPMLPLTYRDYQMLGVEYFHAKGYDVSVVAPHNILLPHYKIQVNISYYNYQNMLEPHTMEELLNILSSLSKNDYIFYYLGGKEAVNLLNNIRKVTEATFVTYISGSVPATSSPCGLLKRLKAKIRPIVKSIIDKKFETDIIAFGAPKDEIIYPCLIGKNTKKIYTHSRDYEVCKNVDGNIHQKKYCVFLDTDIINASDYVIFENKAEKKIDNYYKKLIKFFKFLEDTMYMDVVISAHPKSRILQNRDNFNGFKVVHNNSAALVKNCSFVFSEGTTAVSFAVYFNKPMFFFTMQETSFFLETTCSYAKEFGKKIFYVDDLGNINKELIEEELLNTDKYSYFKYNYLTYKDETDQVFEIIEKELLIGR
ncbi:hypothetical protein [Sulfurimonas sp. NW9]|uniref:hypothetical protein n=1 Tax=Sulfurimonas sp. NW9 TaxID=2922728 RepID=UPI003DA8B678